MQLNYLNLNHPSGIVGSLFDSVAIIVICYIWKLKHACSKFVAWSAALDNSASDLETESLYFGVPIFSYAEFVAATPNFDQSNEIGSVSVGVVHYGKKIINLSFNISTNQIWTNQSIILKTILGKLKDGRKLH